MGNEKTEVKSVCEKRLATMAKRLGDKAYNLIDNKQYTPRFRACQKDDAEVLDQSVKYVMSKKLSFKQKQRYFAKMCAKNFWEKTKTMMRRLINRAIAKSAEVRESLKKLQRDNSVTKQFNASGRVKYEQLIKQFKQ